MVDHPWSPRPWRAPGRRRPGPARPGPRRAARARASRPPDTATMASPAARGRGIRSYSDVGRPDRAIQGDRAGSRPRRRRPGRGGRPGRLGLAPDPLAGGDHQQAQDDGAGDAQRRGEHPALGGVDHQQQAAQRQAAAAKPGQAVLGQPGRGLGPGDARDRRRAPARWGGRRGGANHRVLAVRSKRAGALRSRGGAVPRRLRDVGRALRGGSTIGDRSRAASTTGSGIRGCVLDRLARPRRVG
jgi:hypothetical protein